MANIRKQDKVELLGKGASNPGNRTRWVLGLAEKCFKLDKRDETLTRNSTWAWVFIVAVVLGGLNATTKTIAGTSLLEKSAEKASSRITGNISRKTKEDDFGPFLLMTHRKLTSIVNSSGGVDLNPTSSLPDKWPKMIKELKKKRSSRKTLSITICAANQDEALKQFTPLADQITIMPFANASPNGPKDGEMIWPNYDNPFINRLREIRTKTTGKKLLADIFTGPRPKRKTWGIDTTKRSFVFEEIQWKIYASIGAFFHGLLWQSEHNLTPWANRLLEIESALKVYRHDLGLSRPVGWIKSTANQPISARASQEKLFIVLLNPDIMKVGADGKTISLPLESTARKGEIIINQPEGCYIDSGEYLFGKPLRLKRTENEVRVEYFFKGGGEMLIFHLNRDSAKLSQKKSQLPAKASFVKEKKTE